MGYYRCLSRAIICTNRKWSHSRYYNFGKCHRGNLGVWPLPRKIATLNQSIKNIPPKNLLQGITGYYAHGEKMTFGLVELKAGSIVPLHHHVHEQTTYILEGQLDMVIGGQAFSLTAGMYHAIPSDTPHSAVAITDCKVIDVFSPVREDYKTTDPVKWQTVAESK